MRWWWCAFTWGGGFTLLQGLTMPDLSAGEGSDYILPLPSWLEARRRANNPAMLKRNLLLKPYEET